jgi:hypothetical protein
MDRPCARLIAIVTEVATDRIVGRYLAKSVKMPLCWGEPAYVTPVDAFGVRVAYHPASGLYWVEVVGESKAKYRTGEPRVWQEQPNMRETAKADVIAYAQVMNLATPKKKPAEG